MRLKNLTKEEKLQIAGTVDNQGFWYAVSAGGYLEPSQILENKDDIKEVERAIRTLENFEESLPTYDDIEEDEEEETDNQ